MSSAGQRRFDPLMRRNGIAGTPALAQMIEEFQPPGVVRMRFHFPARRPGIGFDPIPKDSCLNFE